MPLIGEDLQRGLGKRTYAAAGDEPLVVSCRGVEDPICVTSRQRRVAAKPAAGDTSTKRRGASVAEAKERSGDGDQS